jgi:hypothetical protein
MRDIRIGRAMDQQHRRLDPSAFCAGDPSRICGPLPMKSPIN